MSGKDLALFFCLVVSTLTAIAWGAAIGVVNSGQVHLSCVPDLTGARICALRIQPPQK